MAEEIEVKVVDVNKMSEEEKVKSVFLMFEIYFPKSYNLLKGKSFMTLDQFKEYLMTFEVELIEEETRELLKQFVITLMKADSIEEAKKLNVGMDTPQQRFNCYKYASHVIATNMLSGNVYN
ncbi:hypothetical protein [Cetobacterium sp.]|uniref:hypothetical protein n=1 Tax=Cetobacterium sp. TaxID=2071632 RepID=UPI003F2EDB34